MKFIFYKLLLESDVNTNLKHLFLKYPPKFRDKLIIHE